MYTTLASDNYCITELRDYAPACIYSNMADVEPCGQYSVGSQLYEI